MALRFELGDEEDGAVAFGYSPLLESVLSLHVLAEPKHHALQHEWVRAMRRLPPSLRREISALSFLYRAAIPDCLLPTADTGYDGFGVEVARLRRLRTDVVAFELLRPIYDHGGGARPPRRRILSSPEVRAVALKRAGVHGAQARRAAALLFDDPARLIERFASLLESYWEEAFAEEWERIEPRLAESVAIAGRADRGATGSIRSCSRSRRSFASIRAAAASGSTYPTTTAFRSARETHCCSCRACTSGRTCASTATRRGR